MKKLLYAFLLCVSFQALNADSSTLKISVIIPSNWKHAHYLCDILEAYEAQTVLPTEVIISLSEVDQVDPKILDDLVGREWAFPITLLLYHNIQYPGQNRNNGSYKATGDVFVYNDADDLPHLQRIEIIKYFFESFKADHLMHHFAGHDPFLSKRFPTMMQTDKALKQVYQTTEVPFAFVKNYREIHRRMIHGLTHNGNIAISRKVFEKVQWGNLPREEDVEFNARAFAVSSCKIAVKIPLIIYRHGLSSNLDFQPKQIIDHYAQAARTIPKTHKIEIIQAS